MRLHRFTFYGFFYQLIMKIAHRFHWHYMPPIYPDKDTMIWCHWCGAKYVLPKYDPAKMIFQREKQ